MRFWDASAIVPLLVPERGSSRVQALVAEDSDMVVWWATQVECVSALARREREMALTPRTMTVASERLRVLAESWDEVEPNEVVRETAVRFLRVHPLRAADALQLAAAFAASGHRPGSIPFVTFDERLALVAQKEGFPLVNVATD